MSEASGPGVKVSQGGWQMTPHDVSGLGGSGEVTRAPEPAWSSVVDDRAQGGETGTGHTTVAETLCRLAASVFQGCEHASLARDVVGVMRTEGSTDAVGARLDEIQFELSEGPCLDVVRLRGTVATADLHTEARWPRFRERAASETDIRAVISFPLAGDDIVLSLSSSRPDAFAVRPEAVIAAFVAHGKAAMAAARDRENLARALLSRQVISQAVGIIMARQGISADDAFDVLRRASQRLNTKVRDIAERMVQEHQSRLPDGSGA